MRTLATSLSQKIDPKMWPISVKDKLRVDPNLSTHWEPSVHTGKHEKENATLVASPRLVSRFERQILQTPLVDFHLSLIFNHYLYTVKKFIRYNKFQYND